MSDKNIVLAVMISFIIISAYDLATLYINYMCIEAVSEFGVLVVSSFMAYAVKTNRIEL